MEGPAMASSIRRTDRALANSAVLATLAIVCLAPCHLSAVAMTIGQAKSLGGFSTSDFTADRLFEQCGLPGAIIDRAGPRDAKQSVVWLGVTMRLSALDWELAYGAAGSGSSVKPAWANPRPMTTGCLSGIAWLVFRAKGGVGVLSVREKPDGSGYITDYRVPDNRERLAVPRDVMRISAIVDAGFGVIADGVSA
jgi:hypothetical protein